MKQHDPTKPIVMGDVKFILVRERWYHRLWDAFFPKGAGPVAVLAEMPIQLCLDANKEVHMRFKTDHQDMLDSLNGVKGPPDDEISNQHN